MSIKTFGEMMDVSLADAVSKKPVFTRNKKTGELYQSGELDYLNWADCLALLHKHGAQQVSFGNVKSGADHPVFLLDGTLPFVRVFVEVDGDRRELDYPVIDGSRDIDMEKLVQSDVHNATQRAFVKCVAVNWGLGLSLWQKEEKNREEDKTAADLVEISHILAVKDRVERMITQLLKGGMDMSDILSALGLRDAQFRKLMSYYDQLWLLEDKLGHL